MEIAYQRILFLALFAGAFAVLYYVFFAQVLAVAEEPQKITVYDLYKPATHAHEIEGTVLVPSDCFEIKAQVQTLNPTHYAIVLQSWQQSYRTCAATPVTRQFSVTLFAPQDITLMTRLDNTYLTTVTIKDIKH